MVFISNTTPLKICNYDNIYWLHSSKHDYMAIDYCWRLQSQKISFISSLDLNTKAAYGTVQVYCLINKHHIMKLHVTQLLLDEHVHSARIFVTNMSQ